MKKSFLITTLVLFLSAGCGSNSSAQQNKNAAPARSQSSFIFSGTQQTLSSDTAANNKTITLDNDNQSLQMKIGDNFRLSLGTYYHWTVVIDKPLIIVPSATSQVSGMQGTYSAKTPGTATLTATGNPPLLSPVFIAFAAFQTDNAGI